MKRLTMDSPLVGSTGFDTIHNATCVIEYLTEVSTDWRADTVLRGEAGENMWFGQYLLWQTLSASLRHGLNQQRAEHQADNVTALRAGGES